MSRIAAGLGRAARLPAATAVVVLTVSSLSSSGEAAGRSARPAPVAASNLASGKLLVASRTLRDPNFSRTVVLLLRYDTSGAMGVVINRAGETALAELFPDVDGLEKRDDNVFLGGPVETARVTLLVHADKQPDPSSEVFEGVYRSQSRELLERLAKKRKGKARFRVYAGYAGWAPFQLDAEVGRGDWHVVPADVGIVFDDSPGGVWRRLVPREHDPFVASLSRSD